MTKWFKFGGKILKKKDIDFFSLNLKDKSISCDFHQGMSFIAVFEDFHDHETLLNRYEEIGNLLGISNEMAGTIGEVRGAKTGEEKFMGLLDSLSNITPPERR